MAAETTTIAATPVPSFLHPFAKPTKTSFVPIVRGKGALLWDADGTEYVDAMASLWYCAAGHGRADIADAVATQLATLEAYSCFDPFTNEPADALADALIARSPMNDARVFLCGSGSEAIDTAIKLARLAHGLAGHPERTLVISRTRGYHGTNLGGTSAQGIALNRVGWGPLVPDVVQVPSDDVEALSVLMAERADEVAAVITEPVQGAGGVFPPADGYLDEVRRLCDRHGAFLVFDEVITGFGRLGTWFGADHYGVVPDLTTFAKAVTSGYQQVGGVLVGAAVRAPLEADDDFILRHGYTYSGHPAACAAALANIAALEHEGLVTGAVELGRSLGDGLRALAADGVIDHARGVGAVWAAGLRPDQDAMTARDSMLAAGVITRAIGTDTLTFCPPLVTTPGQIDRIVDTLASTLA
ncbi:MAG: aspartate aminotransferase family protein [Acidimicrobiia bacterium]|nr:aspartate aminotransferase family protein [Acidimicrobiia bacterium]